MCFVWCVAFAAHRSITHISTIAIIASIKTRNELNVTAEAGDTTRGEEEEEQQQQADQQHHQAADEEGEEMGSSSSKKLLEEVQLRHGESTVQGRRQYNEGQIRYDMPCPSIFHPIPIPTPLDLVSSRFFFFVSRSLLLSPSPRSREEAPRLRRFLLRSI